MFGHEKFGAYKYYIEFAAIMAEILEKLPPGYAKLADQFRRAAISIVLNIAEGSGKVSDLQKRQCYAIARGETMECAATVDVLLCLHLIETNIAQQGKHLLENIAAILSSVCEGRDRE